MARKLADAGGAGRLCTWSGSGSRGVPLAERLAHELRRLLDQDVEVGAVDITLYRDDLGQGERWPVLRGTEIPFDLDGAEVVLVDDVLFTGRTVRAALNAICDLGRPGVHPSGGPGRSRPSRDSDPARRGGPERHDRSSTNMFACGCIRSIRSRKSSRSPPAADRNTSQRSTEP